MTKPLGRDVMAAAINLETDLCLSRRAALDASPLGYLRQPAFLANRVHGSVLRLRQLTWVDSDANIGEHIRFGAAVITHGSLLGPLRRRASLGWQDSWHLLPSVEKRHG